MTYSRPTRTRRWWCGRGGSQALAQASSRRRARWVGRTRGGSARGHNGARGQGRMFDKVSRNDQCPCGAAKFKLCHGKTA